MTPSARDRISVDLRGLRTALFEQARARGVSPSAFVRHTLAHSLGTGRALGTEAPPASEARPTRDRRRFSLRLTREDADAVLSGARAAGLRVGSYIAGITAGIPLLTHGGNRNDHLAAMTASSA